MSLEAAVALADLILCYAARALAFVLAAVAVGVAIYFARKD